jgi:uncharacterized membrane protein YfcA
MASVLAGAGVGLVTRFLGVGGGFLVVPALIAFAGLDMREAVGTSLLVIAINSAAGFVGHLGGRQLNAGLITLLTTAAVVGALAGERVARQVSTTKLRRGFGLIFQGHPRAPLKSDRDLRSTLDSLAVEEV